MINPIALFRVYNCIWKLRVPYIPGFLRRVNLLITGCDLPPDVSIGRRVRLQHFGRGVIISNRCKIGDDVTIMPNVVIGQSASASGVKELRAIILEDGVLIGAGAVIIASNELVIGTGATVGALALVTRSVSPHDTVVGVPARSIVKKSRPYKR